MYWGRPLEFKGDHVKKQNTGKIGIALIGDFQKDWNTWFPDKPTQAQISALEEIIKDLRQEFNIDPNNIVGHRDVLEQSTLCPGENLYSQLDQIRKYAKEN